MCDFLVLGNYIIEIFYNPESKKVFYSEDSNLINDFKEILSNRSTRLLIIENRELAEEIKERTLKRFKKR